MWLTPLKWWLTRGLRGGGAGIPYLLRDEFVVPRAAGAVIGIPAEPGPGTRAGVDTNGIMTVAGGVLVINGTSAVGDRFYLDGVTRALGRLFKVRVPTNTSHTTNNTDTIGLNVAAVAGNNGHVIDFFITTTSFQIRDNTTTSIIVAGQALPWEFAFILRATGAWTCYKPSGGLWLLMYVGGPLATTPMYPKFNTSTANAKNLSLAGFRVPDMRYIIVPLAYDTYTRANGALGNSETTGPDSQAVTARAWTDQIGTWAVSGNVAVASALSGGLAIATVPTGVADAHIRVRATRSAGNVGGVARYQDANNYLRFYHDGTNAVCEQIVAGTPTTLRTAAATYSAGAYLYLIVRGTTGWLIYNGVAVGASFTVPASVYGDHGTYTTDTGNSLNDFEAWAVGSEGQYSGLESL